MLWNDTLERILTDVLAEAQEDLVGVWLVRKWVQRAFPLLEPNAARGATLGVIERALGTGRVEAGGFEPATTSFQRWHLDARGSVDRIERTWKVLRRDPDIGDNLWLIGNELSYVSIAHFIDRQ
jgi:hypothetical protein